MQLKEILSKLMGQIGHERDEQNIVLHIEERDLASVGMLEALNAIAAHSDIF